MAVDQDSTEFLVEGGEFCVWEGQRMGPETWRGRSQPSEDLKENIPGRPEVQGAHGQCSGGIVDRVGECERRAQRQAGPFLLSYYRRLHGVWIVLKLSNKPLEFQTRGDMIWILFFKVIVTVHAEWSVLGKSGSDLGDAREEEMWMD